MSLTRCFDDTPACVDLASPTVGLRLEDAAVFRKMCLRMLAPRRRLSASGGPVVAHLDPQPAGLGATGPGSNTASGVSSACAFLPASRVGVECSGPGAAGVREFIRSMRVGRQQPVAELRAQELTASLIARGKTGTRAG